MKNKKWIPTDLDGIFVQARDAACEIIRRKNATDYAISIGLVTIVDAIVGGYRNVISVSTLTSRTYDSITR